eukprot:scaffold83955_cov65-Phaeocystis_antarctica.AAC.3
MEGAASHSHHEPEASNPHQSFPAGSGRSGQDTRPVDCSDLCMRSSRFARMRAPESLCGRGNNAFCCGTPHTCHGESMPLDTTRSALAVLRRHQTPPGLTWPA